MLLLVLAWPPPSAAQVSALETDGASAYYYTDHFEVLIDRPVDETWLHVVELGTWMPWMASEDSPTGTAVEGRRVTLYGDNVMEVVKVIPDRMILLANLPVEENGEHSQGTAMVSVMATGDGTLVSIFMNRVYIQVDDVESPQRAKRESTAFAEQRRKTFRDGFLSTLKHLAEQ
ncbi:hypothetical protein F3N42_14925 [Marinihelvus fidelis]|uniref:SRPBCC family protein n=1 Tax=Marinihelvus fidelis TaxID=2613842 RepID=A0A5N0T3K7_9GAMM|nr:hypothetical protein [Marinihelvus fidelis]KAA9129655.1 hypothetical protein F3N42_14925 [Marinihelvus fidelis]